MEQPPVFQIQVINYQDSESSRRKVQNCQNLIASKYGLRNTSFDAVHGIVEVVGEFDESKRQSLAEDFVRWYSNEQARESRKTSTDNTDDGDTCCGCFSWGTKKKNTKNTTARTPQVVFSHPDTTSKGKAILEEDVGESSSGGGKATK